MNKEQKQEVIETLKTKFSQYSNFYITDTQHLSVAQITNLRRHCFDKQVEMKVAKNTLIKKALESLDNDKYSGVYDSLHQVTALMFSDSPKEPALIISSFRKSLNGEKPLLKAAFLNGDIFVGDNQLVALTKIKTKNELIGEVIGLLMSPIQRVIGALQNRSETSEATEAKPEATETKADAQKPKPIVAATGETKAEADKPTSIPQEAKPVTPVAAGAKVEAAEPKAEAVERKTEVEEPKAVAQEAKPVTPVAAEAKAEATEPKAEPTETKVEEAAEPKAIAQETKPVTSTAAEAKTETTEAKAEPGEAESKA